MQFDIVIAGAGIVGLAHAWEARRRGYSVAVVERGAAATGASVRNFGFITVSGQAAGDTWRRARISSHVWRRIAPQAGIPIVHEGSWVVCQRPEAAAVAKAYMQTDMAQDCSFYEPFEFDGLIGADGVGLGAMFNLQDASGLLHSRQDLRVESREAIPRLTRWLAEQHQVAFFFNEAVLGVDLPQVRTSTLRLHAKRFIACSGGDLTGPFKAWIAHHELTLCTLQMLRVRMALSGRLPGSVMTDNSLARYSGWADLPIAKALKARIHRETPGLLAEGIHLIVVQSLDGSLVVGDSHIYESTESVFARQSVDAMILGLLKQTLRGGQPVITERWTGVYPSGSQDALIERVDEQIRLVMVTSGTGASTAFGIAADTMDTWEDG